MQNWATVVLVLLALPVWAQPGPTAQKFLANVKGWTGSLDIHGTGTGTVTGPVGTATYKSDMHVSGTLTLDSFNPLTNSWVGALNGTIVVNEESTIVFGCTIKNTFTANTSAQADFTGAPLKWNLTPDNGVDTWSLWPSNDSVNGTAVSAQTCAGQTQTSSASQPLRFAEISFKMGFPFPATGFDLKDTRPYSCSGCGNANSNPVDFIYTYDLKANTNQPSTTVTTNPGGLRITVDGSSLIAPQAFNWDQGSSHSIGTTTPQGLSTLYTFDSWSDGGAQTHNITVPATSTTYTARFNAQYLLTGIVSPNGSGTLSADPPAIGGYFDNGTPVQVTATANCGFQFANWTGDLTGTTNPQTVIMNGPRTVTANFNATPGGCTSQKATISSPPPGSTLAGSSATFTWAAVTGAAGYWLSVGTVPGGGDIFSGPAGQNTSVTVKGLPANGSILYVRLATLQNSIWQYLDSTYLSAGSSTGAVMVSPTPGSVLGSANVTFTWNAAAGATYYWVDVGTRQALSDIFSQNAGIATSLTVNGLPSDGSALYVRLWTLFGSVWQYNDYLYTASGGLSKAMMTIPTPGSALGSSNVTFTWKAGNGASSYWLDVGRTQGGFELFSQSASTSTSQTVQGLPTDGSTIYVRLWTALGGVWQFNDYTYAAGAAPAKAMMQSPASGSGLSGSTVTFTWSAGTGASAYWLDVGTTQAGFDLFSRSAATSTSLTVTGLPLDGSTIYVRLWTAFGGTWQYNDYSYKAAVGVSKAVMSTPVPGSTLTGANLTFTWSMGTGAAAYWLDVGMTQAGFDIFSQSAGLTTSLAVTGLPRGGATIYVRLWTAVNGVWQYNDYTYTAGN